jgi:hypothetical protein
MKPQDYALPFKACSSKTLITPKYLEKNYWWAYIHPTAVRVFERRWMINLILLGNFVRLKKVHLTPCVKGSAGKPCRLPVSMATLPNSL